MPPGSPRAHRAAPLRPPASGVAPELAPPAVLDVAAGSSPTPREVGSPPVRPTQLAEPRQRWRLVYRRSTDAPAVSQRDEMVAWEAGLVASGLPLAGLDGPRGRPRLMIGAPLAVGMAAERELADIYLTRKVTIDEVRAAVATRLPAGYELIDLYDVWLGVPPLPAQVVAADYRIGLAAGSPDGGALASAARRLLARDSIQRQRAKGTGQVRYDLRPLLDDIEVLEPGPPVVLRVRTRFDPQLGTGRPEEVLASLGDVAGGPCVAAATVRQRLLLAGED